MDPLSVLLFMFLFCLSAFFSGSEIALMSISPHKVKSLVKQKKFGSNALKKIKEHTDKLLIIILICNTFVNTYSAALATTIAINIAKTSGFEEVTAIGIATGIVTFFLLAFGEIVPKSLASKNAVMVSLFVAPIFKGLIFMTTPIIFIFEILIKLFAGKKKIEQMSSEEIEMFIDMGKESGTLEKAEHEKIKNILEFGDITAEEIMIPRVKIEALSSKTTVEEAMKYYVSHTHSRIPVYIDTIDNIEKYMVVRDIIGQEKHKTLDQLNLPEVLKVPLNTPIDKLLETFQKTHKHIAILIDEYGGVEGLVSLEDIVEEVFGDIRDEHDKEVDGIKKISKNVIETSSDELFEDVLDMFHLDLEQVGMDEKEFDGETISYMITYILERFPNIDEIVEFDIFDIHEKIKIGKLECKVLDVKKSKIGKLRITKVE